MNNGGGRGVLFNFKGTCQLPWSIVGHIRDRFAFLRFVGKTDEMCEESLKMCELMYETEFNDVK